MTVQKKDMRSDSDLLAAIKRSGYLLESEIASILARAGFFIESNQVIEDPITGKSREIDLIAEYYDGYDNLSPDQKVCSKINFVFEIKNNSYPLVLMTKFEFSPNIEIWESLKEMQTIPEGVDASSSDGFYEKLLANNKEALYTQYCSFGHKKDNTNNELMALHPEQVYTGLSKITQYCEEQMERWVDFGTDRYYRRFLFLPVLLIKDDLYELTLDTKLQPELHKVDESKLVFNYYFKGTPKISTIWVVTKKGFMTFVKNMIKIERQMEEEMCAVRNTTNPKTNDATII